MTPGRLGTSYTIPTMELPSHVDAPRARRHDSSLVSTCLTSGAVSEWRCVPEQPICGLQRGDNGPLERIGIGEVAAQQATFRLAPGGIDAEHAHDHHVGVEGAHLLHAEQVEAERPLGKDLNRP